MRINDILKGVPLFKYLAEEGRKRLATAMRFHSVSKGDVLFRKGSKGTALYIVKRGRIRLSISSRLNGEFVLAIASEGDYFGEETLLDGKPCLFDAIAMEHAELLLLDRRDFLAFLESNKGAVQLILLSLSQRLRDTVDLLGDACFLNVSERFAKKLVELAMVHGCHEGGNIYIDLPLSQKELASLVGATRESINKELRLLREKGLVSNQEQGICIHDLERLKLRVH